LSDPPVEEIAHQPLLGIGTGRDKARGSFP